MTGVRNRPAAAEGGQGHLVQAAEPVIAYVAPQFPCASETFVYREVRELRRRGWTVAAVTLRAADAPPGDAGDLLRDLVCVYGSRPLVMTGRLLAEVARSPMGALRTLSLAARDAVVPGEPITLAGRVKTLLQCVAALAISDDLRARGAQHIHCHFAHSSTTFGMYLAEHLGVGFSFTGHANDLFQRRSLLRKKLQRARFVCCISQWHRELYSQVNPQAAYRCRVVRCGVDVSAWSPRERSVSSELRVATVCRLVAKKGVDTLIGVLADFGHLTGRAWHLEIAGDGPERAALAALVRRLDCQSKVTFHGAIANDRIPALLERSDLFALLCRSDSLGDRDGIPVAMIESMACGVPVLAGDLPAIRELIEDNVTGLLAGDHGAAVAALTRLAGSAALRQKLALAGRQRVVDEFSLKKNVDRLEQALLRGVHSIIQEPT